jgi:class 3 adenylate cyclase
MKLLWIDDACNDELKNAVFVDEWQHVDPQDILRAATGDDAFDLLRKRHDIALVVTDLLWPGETEHQRLTPTGVDIARAIRAEFPRLAIVTRSKSSDRVALAARIADLASLRIAFHMGIPDVAETGAQFRRELAWASALQTASMSARALKRGSRWAAVLFADISGFTASTQQLWPGHRPVLMKFLRSFYDVASNAVTKHGGVVDKLIGDEVMAVFVGENDRVALAKGAVDAAVEIRNNFLTVARDLVRDAETVSVLADISWELKIGVEAGDVIVEEYQLPDGEIEVCTIGVAVNLASRIKSVQGPYTISIGPGLHRELPGGRAYSTVRAGNPVTLKGFDQPIQVYRLEEDRFASSGSNG